jgi:hypothetical protein
MSMRTLGKVESKHLAVLFNTEIEHFFETEFFSKMCLSHQK